MERVFKGVAKDEFTQQACLVGQFQYCNGHNDCTHLSYTSLPRPEICTGI